MAELTQHERLQPSLLDRLTDEHPDETTEHRDRRFLTKKRLKDAVLRDLGWLLNTQRYTTMKSLEGYPEIENSVINFGIRDLAGASAAGIDVGELEREIKQAILDFEPRILRRTLEVKAFSNRDEMSASAITLEIIGDIWGQPAPFHMMLKTELDLDTGAVSISDLTG
jgi:type VI secretion system protein ImpF